MPHLQYTSWLGYDMLCQAGRVTFSYLADFGHVITFECTMHRVSMQNERGAEAPNTKVRRKAMWGLCGAMDPPSTD